MQQTREIKTFIFSQYFSDGLRITLGVLLPSLLLAQFDLLETGIVVSIGALCVSLADSPGPLTHKRNGMLSCILLVCITAVLTTFINDQPFLLIIWIPALAFFFSMFTVYGNRAASVGTAVLLIMILTLDRQLSAKENLFEGFYLLTGGLWYFMLSISLTQMRPYRLAQQALGSCIREVSRYLEIKADFYDTESDYNANYTRLINQQITVTHEQDAVREILFKSRLMIKESTVSGRQLILVFVDILDLFEQTMATHYDYEKIRSNFGKTRVLSHFRDTILKLSRELDNLSYYIISNEPPKPLYDFQGDLEKLKEEVEKTGTDYNINILVLKKILINLRNITNRTKKIYSYFQAEESPEEQVRTPEDVERFISHQDFDIKLFKNNLTRRSDIFRYSMRVAIACLIGYIISKALPLGYHSYWILLTILVILKPGFSLTKERNYQRLIGTIIGCVAGACVVLYIPDETARFIILLICMIIAYSFQRLNYTVSVLFMTPYILILFSFIGLGQLSLVQERIFDTALGSLIAFGASYLILPSWEHTQIRGFMRNELIANYFYFKKAAEKLTGSEINITEYKLARKDVYVSTAALAAAFQRMLSEPKSKQKNARELHKFVVLNHTLSSYIANLLSGSKKNEESIISQGHVKLMKRILYQLSDSINQLKSETDEYFNDKITIPETSYQVREDSHDIKLITEQLEFVNNLSGDIQKICERLNAGT